MCFPEVIKHSHMFLILLLPLSRIPIFNPILNDHIFLSSKVEQLRVKEGASTSNGKTMAEINVESPFLAP